MSVNTGATFNAQNAEQVASVVSSALVDLEKLIAASGAAGGNFNAAQIEQFTALFGNLAGVVIQAVHDAQGKQVTAESVLALLPVKTELKQPVG